MGQGTSDQILGMIWIQAARCVYVQDKSNSYGRILMKFSGYV